jgi:hypothetical protein
MGSGCTKKLAYEHYVKTGKFKKTCEAFNLTPEELREIIKDRKNER